jgi:hypothetical protein
VANQNRKDLAAQMAEGCCESTVPESCHCYIVSHSDAKLATLIHYIVDFHPAQI